MATLTLNTENKRFAREPIWYNNAFSCDDLDECCVLNISPQTIDDDNSSFISDVSTISRRNSIGENDTSIQIIEIDEEPILKEKNIEDVLIEINLCDNEPKDTED